MAGEIEALTRSVGRLEEKVDRGFAAVDEAFAEQRQFIEFIYDKLNAKMDAGFARIDERFAQVDARFAQVEGRLDRVEERLDRVEERLDRVEQRLDRVEQRLDRIELRLDRIEGALLGFIETQMKTNQLVERRLLLLEQANPMRPM
jgi:DNA repair ATPase RecN